MTAVSYFCLSIIAGAASALLVFLIPNSEHGIMDGISATVAGALVPISYICATVGLDLMRDDSKRRNP